jgi:acyl-CoA synthetase (AMP-forming)/AMP-acid ligase II
MLARSAREHPEKVALVFGDETRTFASLDDRTNRLASALAARGVRRGDKVAVKLYNRLEVVETWFGCQKLGACPVPVNFRLVEREVEYIVQDSGAVEVIDDGWLAPYEELLAEADPSPPATVVDESDLAFLMYTSGTTGRPKGAMLSHGNLVANTRGWVRETGARHEDVWLSGLPLFHIGGVNGVLPFLHLGATCVITPSTGFDPLESLQLLERHAVTMCFFVPTQWQEICSLPEVAEVDTGRLRVAMWGASMAPRSTLELLTRTFPSVEIVNAFGQTEMSSNTCFLKGEDAVRKMGSVGKPVAGVEVRIVDDAGDDVARGEVGEIVYRGPTVMQGYHGKPEATAEAFAGGWFHSGDLVYEDDEGFIYVVDRKKDMIISGGENVYPAEIEQVLREHPAVAECAVVGVEHPRWVETPLAFVVRVPGAEVEENELIAFTRDRLASYKKPSGVVWVDELPRNAAGKVLKRALREAHIASRGVQRA